MKIPLEIVTKKGGGYFLNFWDSAGKDFIIETCADGLVLVSYGCVEDEACPSMEVAMGKLIKHVKAL